MRLKLHRLWAPALAAGLIAAPGPAVAEHTIKIATVAPARTPWADLLTRFKKQVREKTNGDAIVRTYLGGIKGDEQSIVRQAFKGKDIHIAAVSTGALATLVPDIDILELPYLFDSYEEADRILDGPARPIIEKMLEARGFKLIMFSENGYRCFGSKGGFIRSPADLKAKKMRSQENTVHVMTYRALGASPVTISVGEVLSALQTGVVEGFDNTALFTQAVSWHQAVDHFTVSNHIYQPALLAANLEWFNGLPENVQTTMLETAASLQTKGRAAIRALEPLLLKNFENQHVQVYVLTPEEKAVFKKATRPVWDERRETAGPLGKELLDTIIKAKAQ